MDEFYNSHYIRLDNKSRIIHGFSDAFEPPQDGDICINEQGGYQFRLVFADGTTSEENPPLRDNYGASLYKLDKKGIQRRTEAEIEADRPEPSDPPPDPMLELKYRITLLEAELGHMDYVDELRDSGRLNVKQMEALDAVVEDSARVKKEPELKTG